MLREDALTLLNNYIKKEIQILFMECTYTLFYNVNDIIKCMQSIVLQNSQTLLKQAHLREEIV
jgi:hypothetical protein